MTGPPAPSLRVSDADREQVAADLRRHAGDGRLTAEELDERLEAAFSARTVADLDVLLADLPHTPPPPAVTPARAIARREVAQRAGGLAIVCAICVVLWAMTGHGYFWPVWVIVGSACALARHGWARLGPGADLSERHGRGGR